MAKENTKLEIINESPKETHKVNKALDPSVLEAIFGTTNSPKNSQPNVHLINNKRSHNRLYNSNNNHMAGSEGNTEQPSQPLLEPDKELQKPPLAGPEIDDLDDEIDRPTDTTPYLGIDDGLLEPDNTKPEENDQEDSSHGDKPPTDEQPTLDGGVVTDDGKWPWASAGDEPDYPYDDANGFGPRFGIDDRPISPVPGSTPDVNTYQQKKNLAQGMMDLALLSANANQLRYVLESSASHPYYYSSLTFIALSIIFQIAVGVGLIMNSRYDVNDKKEICKADKINNMTVLGIFLITIVNVFITSFSVATQTLPVANTPTIQQAG